MSHALTVGDLMEAARTLENLAALTPRECRKLADHARDLAAKLARACAAAQAAAVEQARRSNG